MIFERARRESGFIKSSLAAICLCAAAHGKAATIVQDYPNRSIRVYDQYGAGGATDVMSRSIAQKFAERFGQSIVIDNRPGVAGNLAAELAAKAPADGYVLLMAVVSDLATSPLQIVRAHV